MHDIYYSSKYGVTFISNPKVACTTIKKSLLGDNGADDFISIHQSSIDTFSLPTEFDKPFFFLTRNPYSRSLSAYKDKVLNNEMEWLSFCKKQNVCLKEPPSLYDFLYILSQVKHLESIDRHFRPQHYNLHLDNITPNFIGRIERMDDVSSFLSSYGAKLTTITSNETNSMNTYKNEISQKIK